MTDRELERLIGAVVLPQVRVAGTTAAAPDEVVPDPAYLARFPPTGLVVFGYTPSGPVSPLGLLEGVRAECARNGQPRPFAASDMEQGAGHQLRGATRLPPALALAAAALGAASPDEGLRLVRSAGALTAREARAAGIELVLAPVCDVNTRADNPIIAVRSFGDRPEVAGRFARAFLEGLHAGGAGGCPKHFPGHGDTAQDSHIELARVDRDLAGLRSIELVPFRTVLAARPGCARPASVMPACVMIGHLDVPALTGEPGLAATLSARAIACLREELGFDGAVLSDAMLMGALDREPERYARALAAGCDGLLCPHDPAAAAEELLAAVEGGTLARSRLVEAAARMRALRDALQSGVPARDEDELLPGARAGAAPDERAALARALAERALVGSPARWPWRRGRPCELTRPIPAAGPAGQGGASDETRAALEGLREAVAAGTESAGVVVPVVCTLAAWRGGYGLAPGEVAELEARVGSIRDLGWPVGLVWFGSPQSLPTERWSTAQPPVLLAFAPTPPMVAAVAAWLAGRLDAGGSLPSSLG